MALISDCSESMLNLFCCTGLQRGCCYVLLNGIGSSQVVLCRKLSFFYLAYLCLSCASEPPELFCPQCSDSSFSNDCTTSKTRSVTV